MRGKIWERGGDLRAADRTHPGRGGVGEEPVEPPQEFLLSGGRLRKRSNGELHGEGGAGADVEPSNRSAVEHIGDERVGSETFVIRRTDVERNRRTGRIGDRDLVPNRLAGDERVGDTLEGHAQGGERYRDAARVWTLYRTGEQDVALGWIVAAGGDLPLLCQ